jgi:hypothetical protein
MYQIKTLLPSKEELKGQKVVLPVLLFFLTFIAIIELIPSSIFKILLGVLIWFCIFNDINIKEKNFYLSSCKVAFYHSTICVLLMSPSILFNMIDYKSLWIARYDSLIFSLTYFIYDLYHVIYSKFDKLFIIHHSLCILTIGSILYLDQLGPLIAQCLFLGELTNPLQNLWRYFKIKKIVYWENHMFKLFSILFLLIRGIVSPLYVYYAVNNIIYSDINLFFSLTISTYLLAGTLGSLIWCLNLIQVITKKNTKIKCF